MLDVKSHFTVRDDSKERCHGVAGVAGRQAKLGEDKREGLAVRTGAGHD